MNNNTNQIAKYMTEHGEVKLSINIIRQYLSPNATNQEAMLFLMLCKNQQLNPFVRDAYLIKYGGAPATMVVSKDVFIRRSKKNLDFISYEAGIIIKKKKKLFGIIPLWWIIEKRIGTYFEDGKEILKGGWAKIYMKSWGTFPLEHSVRYEEYEGKKKDGTPTKSWKEKPGTMIRKVALMQALREAFPTNLQACYEPGEMGVEEEELPDAEKAFDNPEKVQTKKQKQPSEIFEKPDNSELYGSEFK